MSDLSTLSPLPSKIEMQLRYRRMPMLRRRFKSSNGASSILSRSFIPLCPPSLVPAFPFPFDKSSVASRMGQGLAQWFGMQVRRSEGSERGELPDAAPYQLYHQLTHLTRRFAHDPLLIASLLASAHPSIG